ncbi:MAG TPA: hypothetical protein VG755_30355, partial [Nannocystaceae bacterium]|nr:hypothetical protein [Nannocystaceae bacterium]
MAQALAQRLHARRWLTALLFVCAVVWPARARADDVLQVAIEASALPAKLCAGEKLTAEVTLRNDGMVPWSDVLGDRLAYHWLRDGEVIVREGRRTSVGGVVMPGA